MLRNFGDKQKPCIFWQDVTTQDLSLFSQIWWVEKIAVNYPWNFQMMNLQFVAREVQLGNVLVFFTKKDR